MPRTQKEQDPVILMLDRLLSGPSRPGQAFTLPGTNYDNLYQITRRLKACVENDQETTPICICCDDRTIVTASLLAVLVSGPEVVIPHCMSADTLSELKRLTGYKRAIGTTAAALPDGVLLIDPAELEEEADTLLPDAGTEDDRLAASLINADRTWVRFSIDDPGKSMHVCPHTVHDIISEICDLDTRFEFSSNDRILATIPPLSIYGLIYGVLVPLAASARVAAASPSAIEAIQSQMAALSPTIMVGTPDHYRAITANPPDNRSLRVAFSSFGVLSAAERKAVLAATGGNVVEVSGPAQTAVNRKHLRPGEARQSDIKQDAEPHQITFEPAGRKLPADADSTLHELAAAHHISIRADCGGAGICGKCRILVDPKEGFPPPTDAEIDVLTSDQLVDGYRLACQVPAAGAGTVTIPEALSESAETRGKTDIAGSYPVDPDVRRIHVEGRPPDLNTDNTPESMLDWLSAQTGEPAVATADIPSLRRLGQYRDNLKNFTVVVHAKAGIRRILKGKHSRSLGFAVDLGTTSIAGYLCDMNTGTILATDACVNPQRRFGEDVISRISRINENDAHLEQMQRLAADGINVILTRCLEQVDMKADTVDQVAVCGNTTMQQIFTGLHPYGLGVFPYFPLTLTPPLFSAGELNLAVDPAVPVFPMPVISGFVGGDTMGVILADRPHERDEISLIVDIGTNGEVVLGNRDALWVTSCATGPALEGAQISCGMRAVSGAIHRIRPATDNNHVEYDVLGTGGGHRPMGICGSGIIDAIAALRQIGVILPTGRLNEASDGVFCDEGGIGRHYTIADGSISATGSNIAVTLKDVRQIQLAKAALSVGIEFLMRKAGITRIDRTILTGAFGARFNWKNALSIGMLPPAVADSDVMPKDNLAGLGVLMALLDKHRKSDARALCRRVRCLELASEAEFAMAFAKATAFPELS